MEIVASIENIAKRFLTPQETLPQFLFGKDETMHEEVRSKLLKKADFIIQNTVAKFPGLEVDDICLIGSLPTYRYHDQSDFDISIVVKNTGCPYLPKDGYELMVFLISLLSSFKPSMYLFNAYGRAIDFSMEDKIRPYLGCYSLKNNHWIYQPQKYFDEKITVASLVYGYYDKIEEIANFMAKIPLDNDRYSLDNIDKMFNYYYKLVSEFAVSSQQNYIIYKMLSSQGIPKELGQDIVSSYVHTLTFRKEDYENL